MSDQSAGGAPAPAPAPAPAAAPGADPQPTAKADAASGEQPKLTILTQYIKDLSFENPNAPVIYAQMKGQPKITVSVDVQASKLQEKLAEVSLRLKLEAKSDDKTAFLCELDYAGLCALGSVPSQAEAEQLYLVDAAQMLFPFARAVLATQTRDGGFAPLLLAPIDFHKLYEQRKGGKGGPTPGQVQVPPQEAANPPESKG